MVGPIGQNKSGAIIFRKGANKVKFFASIPNTFMGELMEKLPGILPKSLENMSNQLKLDKKLLIDLKSKNTIKRSDGTIDNYYMIYTSPSKTHFNIYFELLNKNANEETIKQLLQNFAQDKNFGYNEAIDSFKKSGVFQPNELVKQNYEDILKRFQLSNIKVKQ